MPREIGQDPRTRAARKVLHVFIEPELRTTLDQFVAIKKRQGVRIKINQLVVDLLSNYLITQGVKTK